VEMRRCVALALLLLFVAQTSGAALSATPGPRDVSGFNLLATVVNPLRLAIVNSRVFATATGTQDRYAAMHAPAPLIVHPTQIDSARLLRALHPLHPKPRHGQHVEYALPSRSALDPRHRRLDPLAMRRSAIKPTLAPEATPGSLFGPLRSLSLPTSAGAHATAKSRNGQVKPALITSTGTGIAHWWTYEERGIPGIGKAMVNVGTGNFLVSALDVDVHEQGIDLAFQRTYNSQSLHDYNGDDGGDPAIFGNRWTNDFDANIVYDSVANTITVYDLNGTACTYTANGGVWSPCTGQYATLMPTDGTDCTYEWIKKTGTIYLFHSDVSGGGCGIQAAKRGHLQQIVARNNNNSITFNYSYVGSGHGSESISEIDAVHTDGHNLVMQFGLIPGTSINELATITRPDGAELQYSYDTSGNLLEVDKPGNNSATSVPTGHGVPQGDAPETYAYSAGTSTLQDACGPRCTVSGWNNHFGPTDGGDLSFTADSSLRLTSWSVNAALNITPYDGTSTPLVSGISTSYQTWYTANFVYGSGSACSGASAGTTTMCDSDGHSTIWTIDSSQRVSQTQDWAGTAEALWILTSQGWDTNNDLTSTTDANGNVTQYAYDSPGYNQGGNLVEMQQPLVGDIGGGQLNPLSSYSYDPYNNVTAYCDPVFNQTQGNTWVPPTDSLCPKAGGAARFTFTPDSAYEPYGCLTDIKKPGGYNTTISYPSPGSCGYGLPTETQGDSVTQYDQSTRTPTQDFSYNAYGNLTNYDKGTNGSNTLQSWTLGYDPENQLEKKTENDSQIGLTESSFSCYYADGSPFYTETPSQHHADGDEPCPSTATMLAGNVAPPQIAIAYFYDLDADQVKVFTHKGCSTNNPCQQTSSKTACVNGESNPPGTTCKSYDGLDRLVETIEPYDSRNYPGGGANYEFYNPRWMNRYIYDLSMKGGGANLSIADSTGSFSGLVAYGNLYKTKEYLPQNKTLLYTDTPSNWNWSDVRGTTFDGLDRAISKYELAYGNTTPVTTNSYDCTGQYDLLCSTENAVGQTKTYIYDGIRRVRQLQFSGTAPLASNQTYTFDADGRTTSAANSTGTMNYTYDVDGNELSVTEPNAANTGEPAASLICYAYYGDGLREYLSIGLIGDTCGSIPYRANPSNGGISQQRILSYSFTEDSLPASQQVNWGSLKPDTFSWLYYPSGRVEKQIDPLSGQTVSVPQGGGAGSQFSKKIYSYDQYGRVNGLTLPETYQESTFVYDDDDGLAAYTYAGANVVRSLTVNARGELLEDSLSNTALGFAQGPTQSANGVQVGNGDSQPQGGGYVQAPPTTLQFDVRTDMTLCVPNPQWGKNPGIDTDWTYKYDGAGRQTDAYEAPNGSGCTTGPDAPTTYDAENHLQSTENPWLIGGSTYSNAAVTWGPDERHRVESFSPGSVIESAHWDGDTLLFANSTSSSSTAILYIGKLGVLDSAGDLYISDRDQTGAQVTAHGYTTTPPYWMPNGNWSARLTTGSVRNLYINKAGQDVHIQLFNGSCGFTYGNSTYDCPAFGPTFAMNRSDGYTMVGGLVQGARTYDPTSGQWLTPDAYPGNAHDPMSQKPFMWNGNNPLQYADPTGYYGTSQGLDGSGGQPLFTDSSLTGETEANIASNYFTTMEAQKAIESGYASAIMALHRNLDPHNVDDQSFLANNIRASLAKSNLGTWSLTNNFVTSTLSGVSGAVAFALQVLIGEAHLSMVQGGVSVNAEEEYLRYTHLPGNDEVIQSRHPAGLDVWEATDISPDENLKT